MGEIVGCLGAVKHSEIQGTIMEPKRLVLEKTPNSLANFKAYVQLATIFRSILGFHIHFALGWILYPLSHLSNRFNTPGSTNIAGWKIQHFGRDFPGIMRIFYGDLLVYRRVSYQSGFNILHLGSDLVHQRFGNRSA